MRYAICHPNRKHWAKGLCKNCRNIKDNRERYRKRRAAGWPYWAASGRTLQGAVGHIAVTKKYRENHREQARAYDRKYAARNKLLYGGRPSANLKARIKWLAAKEAERKKKLSPAPSAE